MRPHSKVNGIFNSGVMCLKYVHPSCLVSYMISIVFQLTNIASVFYVLLILTKAYRVEYIPSGNTYYVQDKNYEEFQIYGFTQK